MSSVYVVGGTQREGGDELQEWKRYRKAVIARLDLETGRSEICVEYVSPAEACADELPSIVFKAGTLRGDLLYLCTQTEVLIYRVPGFERVGYVSLPRFNDLHHVRPGRDGALLVANTGLDTVVEVTTGGEVLREWSASGEDPWARFSREVDYRKVATTKPHRSHPNFVFLVGDDLWVTRFNQKDAICLTRSGRRIDIGLERVHDGTVCGGEVYFTTVDGRIAVADLETLAISRVVDLNEIHQHRFRVLGWCRSLELLDPGRLVVGFSRTRPTTSGENVRWIQRRVGGLRNYRRLPTRIVLYDLEAGRALREHSVEELGVDAVFSVHRIDD